MGLQVANGLSKYHFEVYSKQVDVVVVSIVVGVELISHRGTN